jgi:hypothetical protein
VGAEHTRAGRFRAKAGGMVGASIAAGWLLSPLLRYANPLGLLACAVAIGLLVLVMWEHAVVVDVKKPVSWWLYVLIYAAPVAALLTFVPAVYSAQGADRQCAVIQQRMLSGRVGSDPADAFQALGCRPQFSVW